MKAWAPELVIWKDNDPKDEMAPDVFPNVVYHAESRTPTARGHLYQIRNLDYSMDAHLQDFRCVVIYIPKEGIAHINPSFAGSIGCHTGMNAEGITLTEIGDSPGRDRPYDLHGLHFMMMFRDILYSASTLDQAVQMIKDTKRIKKYHFVVGDGKVVHPRSSCLA